MTDIRWTNAQVVGGRYNAASCWTTLAVVGIDKALLEKTNIPKEYLELHPDLNKGIEYSLQVCSAIRFAKKKFPPKKGKDGEYYLKEPCLYGGIKAAINKELTSGFSSENVGDLGKKVEEFWNKWESRCNEIESLMEKIKSEDINVEEVTKVLSYLREIRDIVERNLGMEGRRASSYISGSPVYIS